MPIWAPSRPVAQRSPDMDPEYDNGSLLDDAIISTPRTPIGPNGIGTHPTDHAGLVERGPLGGLHGGLLTHLLCRGYNPIPTAVRTKEQNLQMALAIDPPGQRSRQSYKLLWAADCTGWESAHDRTSRRPRPRVGLRRWIGNAAEPKGTVRELMHQGQRLAAIGNLRLHEMQTRIKRENLIRRSIDAAPYAPRE